MQMLISFIKKEPINFVKKKKKLTSTNNASAGKFCVYIQNLPVLALFKLVNFFFKKIKLTSTCTVCVGKFLDKKN